VPTPSPPSPARPRRPLAGFALAVALVPALVSCGLLREAPTTEAALIGDSITDQSRDTFDDVLGDDYLLDVRAFPGVRTDEWIEQAQLAALEQPQLAVVNLGTNDVFQGAPLERSMAAVQQMLDLLGFVPCRYVVTVNEAMVSNVGDDLPARARDYNAALRSLAAAEQVEVLDWSAVVVAELAAGEPGGSVTVDTVHPTDRGEGLLADLYRQAMDECVLPP